MTPEQMKGLREPFPAEMVGKLPKGNVELDYVGHGAVTSRLLEVDPEWSWEPLSTDEHGFPRLDSAGNLWIKLTVGGVTRLGVGDGPNMKVLIGDALRNAAMRFGVALDLWIRGHAEDDEKQPQQPAHRAKPKVDNSARASELGDRIAMLPEEAQTKILGWFGVPVADWHGLADEHLDKLAEVIAKAEVAAGDQSTPSDSGEGGEGSPTSPVDPPAASPAPTAAERAAARGLKDKPALGAVREKEPMEALQDAFPGAEEVAS